MLLWPLVVAVLGLRVGCLAWSRPLTVHNCEVAVLHSPCYSMMYGTMDATSMSWLVLLLLDRAGNCRTHTLSTKRPLAEGRPAHCQCAALPRGAVWCLSSLPTAGHRLFKISKSVKYRYKPHFTSFYKACPKVLMDPAPPARCPTTTRHEARGTTSPCHEPVQPAAGQHAPPHRVLTRCQEHDRLRGPLPQTPRPHAPVPSPPRP